MAPPSTLLGDARQCAPRDGGQWGMGDGFRGTGNGAGGLRAARAAPRKHGHPG